jgi:signal transduction histidine kinase/CheY-like chemotaxis protein
MTEVSCRVLELVLATIRELEIPLERFIEGLPITRDEILDKQARISWNTYCLLAERLETACEGRIALEDIGARFLEVPTLKGIAAMVSLFASVQTFYWAAQKFANPRLFSMIEGDFEVIGPRSLRLRTTILEPHRSCRAYFRIAAGTLRAAPRMLGLPDSAVRTVMGERHCDYFVEHAPSHTIWSRLRQAFMAIFAARSLFEELRTQNDELTRQLAETSKLHQSSQEALRLKSTFLANITHEIRTPMNGIQGISELLIEGEEDAERREYLHSLNSSAKSLLTLLENVIDYAKVEAGNLTLDNVDFDPRASLDDAVLPNRDLASLKRIHISTSVASDVPASLRADRIRVTQTLANLVNNAVKFTDAGSVHLSIARIEHGTDSVVRFEVRDTGPGIPDAAREKIFDPFVQADDSLSRKHGGAGLGLAIGRQLVQLMGGRMGFETELGKGTTFWFTIPYWHAPNLTTPLPATRASTPPPRSAQPAPATSPPSQAPVRSTAASAGPRAPARGRILVAEDNLVNQKLLVRLLEKLGYQVDVAENGRQAVAAFQKQSYEAILMDLQMPEMTGFEATEHIRSLETQHTPIIAVTANSEEEFRNRAFAVGMDEHLSKPIQRSLLESTLARLIRPVSLGADCQPAEAVATSSG